LNKLYRSRSNRLVAGVCAGLGEYVHMDPTLFRLLYVVISILTVFPGFIFYIAAWIIIPEEP
jgi:phage shock protein PspC (stress-responsive transcriptional regulator)